MAAKIMDIKSTLQRNGFKSFTFPFFFENYSELMS